MSVATVQAVRTFRLAVPVTVQPPLVADLETSLISQLPGGASLLRWAIVDRTTDGWVCEGAYITA